MLWFCFDDANYVCISVSLRFQRFFVCLFVCLFVVLWLCFLRYVALLFKPHQTRGNARRGFRGFVECTTYLCHAGSAALSFISGIYFAFYLLNSLVCVSDSCGVLTFFLQNHCPQRYVPRIEYTSRQITHYFVFFHLSPSSLSWRAQSWFFLPSCNVIRGKNRTFL
jgi:hypothetical protein